MGNLALSYITQHYVLMCIVHSVEFIYSYTSSLVGGGGIFPGGGRALHLSEPVKCFNIPFLLSNRYIHHKVPMMFSISQLNYKS